ncbi:tRNA-Thr(GGU) m(6)t(6)A37 methyltransferase TsaA [Thiothrix eikelboomii]|uniref:tRNA-Thr(GGU) m(6)t(6)A37 methyltransferase TsaA n=1 Tax=Thiothrix eikelboomii TaxID=92487 RepID=A0A1T4VQS2_9GAMM|nr:tRNA-Thr(GGU) m(6)t(6)A37 methyltransferase TsaA [Thiothrix eikelboomii]
MLESWQSQVITGRTSVVRAETGLSLKPIGFIQSCYKEKFGIPRQPGLVTAAQAQLQLLPEFSQVAAFKGLEQFSHLWLIFCFHANPSLAWSNTVRPPRLGGNKRLGVFATRSTFRPNPLGLSVARLEKLEFIGQQACLHLSAVDLLDGTPVFDIKPYLPYADSLPAAQGGFAEQAPSSQWVVNFTEEAHLQCQQKSQQLQTNLELLIRQILEQDPRPSYRAQQEDARIYAMKLYDFDLRWHYKARCIEVLGLVDLFESQATN